MNGFLRVNTFLRDVVFINGQNIKYIIFHYVHYGWSYGQPTKELRMYRILAAPLRFKAAKEYRKLLGEDWDDPEFTQLMKSSVTEWCFYIKPEYNVIHIYSTNIPKGAPKI